MEVPNIELLRDLILIYPHDPPAKTEGGLFNPTEQKGIPVSGEVLLVGKRYQAEQTGEWIEIYLNVGDVVYFNKHAFTPFLGYLIGKQGDTHCIISTKKQ